MNAFERWASGLLDYEYIQEMIRQREYHASQILSPDQMKQRQDMAKQRQIVEQLKLF